MAQDIRKKSSDESQRFFRATLDSLTSHIAILDEKGTILEVNQAWRRFAEVNGYGGADFGIGANYLESCESDGGACLEGAAAAAGIRKVLAGELTLFTLEYPCHGPTEKRWFLMRVTRFAPPGPVRAVVEHQNVTAEKLAAENLEALRFSIDRSGDPMYWLRPDQGFRLTFANAAAIRHFGYPEEELLRTSVPDWAPMFTPERCDDLWERLKTEGTIVFECFHRRKDGALIPVEVSTNYFSFGGVEYITGSFRDITRRKRAEEDLRQSEAELRANQERLSLIQKAARIGHFEWNIQTNENLWSRDLEILYGLPEGAFGGGFEGWARLVHPEDLPQAEQDVHRALAEGELDSEWRVVWPDGSVHWLQAQGKVFYDEQGRPLRMLGVNLDVTEPKRAAAALRASEQSLRRQTEALQEADRRKDDFLAVLGHELRNPLAPIRNAVQILRLKGPADPALEKARDMIDRQAAHMTRLVDDLLEVSRITRGKIRLEQEAVDVAAVIGQAVEASRPLIETRGHELRISLPAAPVRVRGDATRLAQVVSNLLNNAAKYTEVGGRIELTAERAGSEAVLSVKDNGVGIPPEMLAQVFDMFAQVESSLDRAQGGLGIGLTLVRRLVEMHGGTVEADSAGPGRGSSFVVRLPALADAPPEEYPDHPKTEDAPAEARWRVLVVDDNTDSAASLGMLLRLWEHEVRLAHDGLTALTAAREFRPQVILLDLGLPKLDGLQVARHVRQEPELSEVVLVAMTGYGQEEDRRRTKEAGFDCHLVKPVDLEALQGLLRRGAQEEGSGADGAA